ncbi:MAG: livQ 1, partial [Frondihabitans sp.]|nr:livQ 1 [Frondihabitans sp.]
MAPTPPTDLLIVGSGIMGAAVANLVRRSHPHARITMVDGGGPIGPTPGLHLHDVADQGLWESYNERVSSGIQGMYTGAEVVTERA